ncbi:hypothetical protein LTR53_010349 [Teratosphaeriaceae sp. CCFEE 6253]|nr:hypothetical protein LTR53_010349 [Teratosphaeriaceae sp. CCFEE 6253]
MNEAKWVNPTKPLSLFSFTDGYEYRKRPERPSRWVTCDVDKPTAAEKARRDAIRQVMMFKLTAAVHHPDITTANVVAGEDMAATTDVASGPLSTRAQTRRSGKVYRVGMPTNATGDVVICDSIICNHCNTSRRDPDRKFAAPEGVESVNSFMSMYHGYPFVHTTNMETQGDGQLLRCKSTARDTTLLAPARFVTAGAFAVDDVAARNILIMQCRVNACSYCSSAPQDGPSSAVMAALTIEDDTEIA